MSKEGIRSMLIACAIAIVLWGAFGYLVATVFHLLRT